MAQDFNVSLNWVRKLGNGDRPIDIDVVIRNLIFRGFIYADTTFWLCAFIENNGALLTKYTVVNPTMILAMSNNGTKAQKFIKYEPSFILNGIVDPSATKYTEKTLPFCLSIDKFPLVLVYPAEFTNRLILSHSSITLTIQKNIECKLKLNLDTFGNVINFLHDQNGKPLLAQDGTPLIAQEMSPGLPTWKETFPRIEAVGILTVSPPVLPCDTKYVQVGSSFQISSTLNADMWRYTLLSDWDDFTLDQMDNMTFEELDMIYIT